MSEKRRLRKGDLDPEHRAKMGLRRAFNRAQSFYWCNTDRDESPGGNELEQRMRKRGEAAAWMPFVYQGHMKRVRRGDLVFMYADGVGVIAVGVAKESRLEIVGPDHPSRLRECEDGEFDEEWRIPVRWLVWDESAPCRISKPLRGTFLELRIDGRRFKKIRRHFLR